MLHCSLWQSLVLQFGHPPSPLRQHSLTEQIARSTRCRSSHTFRRRVDSFTAPQALIHEAFNNRNNAGVFPKAKQRSASGEATH